MAFIVRFGGGSGQPFAAKRYLMREGFEEDYKCASVADEVAEAYNSMFQQFWGSI